MVSANKLSTRVYTDFAAPDLAAAWESALRNGSTKVIYLSLQWQRLWWDVVGRGDLLIVVAARGDEIVAIAPLFAEDGVVHFVGSSPESYYLDLVGRVTRPDDLLAILDAARACVPGFSGFELHWVPDESPTVGLLETVASRMGLDVFELWRLPAPKLDLVADQEAASAATRKKSLRRKENRLRREGILGVTHMRHSEPVLHQLPLFFDQHIARWRSGKGAVGFSDPKNRDLYRSLVKMSGEQGWLRFTRLDWNGDPIAFHIGFCYQGTYTWFQPSFSVEHAAYSPGEVLIRHVLLDALAEGATTFDLGPGEQEYKFRFANRVDQVKGWGLYA